MPGPVGIAVAATSAIVGIGAAIAEYINRPMRGGEVTAEIDAGFEEMARDIGEGYEN